MGSAADFLSYFVLGTDGMKKFGQGAIVNTDDNLYLEFSAPYAIGKAGLMGENITAILQQGESILPYLLPARGEAARTEQVKRWAVNKAAAGIAGQALALYLNGLGETPEFSKLMEELDTKYPRFAPGRFLKNEYGEHAALKPALLEKKAFVLLDERGSKVRVEISAVLVPVSREKTSVAFVDNDAKVKYGEIYISGDDKNIRSRGIAKDVMASIEAAYQRETELADRRFRTLPSAESIKSAIKDVIARKVRESQ
jgi:spermidine synthase